MANKEVVIGEKDKKVQFGLGTALIIIAMIFLIALIVGFLF